MKSSRVGAREALRCTTFFEHCSRGSPGDEDPGPQAAKLSSCTPEKLVSPDVLAIPSRYHTAFPAVPWVLYRWYLHKKPYSPLNYRTSHIGPPRSSRSGAKPSCNSPRRLSETEVTIDCYSEKRSRPSQWLGCAERELEGPPVAAQDTRQKPLALTQSIVFFRAGSKNYINKSITARSIFEHASIYSPSIRSPSWERKWIRFNGDRSPVRIYIYYGASDHSSNLERDHARVTSQLFGLEVFSFVFF